VYDNYRGLVVSRWQADLPRKRGCSKGGKGSIPTAAEPRLIMILPQVHLRNSLFWRRLRAGSIPGVSKGARLYLKRSA
jgi:hypothetical protein